MEKDWEHTRKFRYSHEAPPPRWPKGVQSISMNGLSLLGIEPNTNEPYWDGKSW